MTSDDQRYIVWMPSRPSWELPPASHAVCMGGGHRTLHELAVAIAATGRRVEVRGEFDFGELSALAAAAGSGPEIPVDPAKPSAGDVVIIPEGLPDPLTFGLLALAPVRRILVLLAPPGLFGWPFVEDPVPGSASDIDPKRLARPEHFQAMAAMGFELWSNAQALVERILATGLPAAFIGSGLPTPFPDPLPKRFDVITVANSKWSPDARKVVAGLDPAVLHYEIPAAPHHVMLRRFGEARIFIHPLGTEGVSRIEREARAMGAVPAVLDPSQHGVGLDKPDGALAVESLERMPDAIMRLLDDEDRLKELRERGMRSAREEVDWKLYLERVEAALERPRPRDPAAQARAVIGGELALRERALADRLDEAMAEVARLERSSSELEAERDALASELERAKEALAAIRDTRAWRVAGRFWRIRDRLKRGQEGVVSRPPVATETVVPRLGRLPGDGPPE